MSFFLPNMSKNDLICRKRPKICRIDLKYVASTYFASQMLLHHLDECVHDVVDDVMMALEIKNVEIILKNEGKSIYCCCLI